MPMKRFGNKKKKINNTYIIDKYVFCYSLVNIKL